MIQPAENSQRIHLPPGSVFTGLMEYACDGAIVEARIDGTLEEPSVASCNIVELHDLAYGRRRTRQDVGAFLRRCLKRLQIDGMIIVLGDQILAVPAERITVQKVRFQQYCSRTHQDGPFSEFLPGE
ncbi:MAG: hypothetical protein ACNA8W_06600 [Bradymonadaceae bacterium]